MHRVLLLTLGRGKGVVGHATRRRALGAQKYSGFAYRRNLTRNMMIIALSAYGEYVMALALHKNAILHGCVA